MGKIIVALVGAVGFGVLSAGLAAAHCESPKCPDEAGVAALRTAIAAQCNCASTTVKAYRGCVKNLVKASPLSKPCKALVTKCEKKSTCGKSGTVVCCKKPGKPGKVVKESKCKASVCGAFTNAFDACDEDGTCNTTTTTTTTVTTTTGATTTTMILCGDGVVQAGEQCDPPCGAGCAAGQLCSSTCACVPQTACTCGAPDPTQLRFTTGAGVGNCGQVLNSSGNPLLQLACGGLYFGGGAVATPLPATVPDGGALFTKTCCSGNTLTMANTTISDPGINLEVCTSRGCLFGPPLPIPNTTAPPLSVCIINEVAANAAGQVECTTGDATLNLPLTSKIHLTGDPDNNPTNGLQPCPICSGEPSTCSQGPNAGMPCDPVSVGLGTAGPTSPDCPPVPGTLIGGLPIPFLLTTGTSMDMATASGTQQRVFCGFCRDSDGTGFFAGNPQGTPPAALKACSSNADCAQPYESCEQNNQGAFLQGGAASITATGVPAGNLTDRQPHNTTLVSVFCIPPTFNAAVDGNGDLPGPGAVSLPGTAQLLPTLPTTTTTTTTSTTTTTT